MLPHELSGNNNSDTLLIFLHGFPDSVRLWDSIIYIILILRHTLRIKDVKCIISQYFLSKLSWIRKENFWLRFYSDSR